MGFVGVEEFLTAPLSLLTFLAAFRCLPLDFTWNVTPPTLLRLWDYRSAQGPDVLC